jgi:uncharacterized protein YegP (UPF0339 family)
MPGKFVVERARNHQYYYNLKAGNGEVILTSELYKAKASALGGIESVRANAPLDERFERRKNGAGYSFTLAAGNDQIIGRSESYTTAASREKGIDSVKKNAPDAPVDDRSESEG